MKDGGGEGERGMKEISFGKRAKEEDENEH